ncbi:DeoR/GlpR family DNA-binding transcription regulator [Pseudonocardia alaniniphila]|uniref:DeoR/GlpR family DNA-binding transcription regulator n=1 Tax=Pseudonocardia alaniniphila TaxID=75291 RepID=A0ABS9TU16_9PSEU|nr:DeoR/GlpR family DNA-binding transcription regulator [Pseudonocardia alaniniphila]MCH6172065.1 DeoR/GlpR family DNA-binding transcription regulator [Pseudonocardia alaniniphila]
MSRGLTYGFAQSRRDRLLTLLQEQGFCATTELVRYLGVSDMTVRRDVQKLADEGLVRIVHGGVSVLPPGALQGSGRFDERSTRMAAAKRAAGRLAASRVRPGDNLALDAGTTTLEVAKALPTFSALTVATHSATAIAELMERDDVTVIGLGGVLHHETRSFAGTSVLRAIKELQVGTLYLAASGVGPRGVFCANDFDAVTKRALIEVAREVVLVVDSSKFDMQAPMVRVCGLDAVGSVVVDDGIHDESRQMLERKGVTLEVAQVPATRG